MAFDPDAFLSKLAVERASGTPAAVGTPPGIAAPDTSQNSAQLPNYAHDPVPPEKVPAVREAIARAIAANGFDALHPDAQRGAIIDAVHGVTRAPEQAPEGPGFLESLVNSAGRAVPLGHQSGALMETIAHGGNFTDNYNALEARTDAGEAAHPVAGIAGRTAGGLATMAATGGLGGVAAGAPAAAPALARAAAPLTANAVAGGVQGAADAASEGADAEETFQRGLAGATVGAGIATAIPAASKALGKLFAGALKRSDERILSDAGDVATKKMRDKINEKADDVIDLVRRTPGLRETLTTPSHFVAAAEEHLSANGTRLNKIYDAADKINGMVDGARLASVVTEAQQRAQGRLATKEVAAALQPTVDKLAGESGRGISGAEIREEISRLQGVAFDRSPGAAPTPTRAAAGLAAGKLKDLLEEHVHAASETVRSAAGHAAGTTPGLVPTSSALGPAGGATGGLSPAQLHQMADELNVATVKSLNSDQTVLMRLKKAAEYRASVAPNQQGTRLSKVAHAVVTHGAHVGGAGEIVHGLATGDTASVVKGVAIAAAPHVIPPMARAVDEGIASTARALNGTQPAATGLVQKLSATNDAGGKTAVLMDHIFGGRKDDTKPAAAPYTFGGDSAEGGGGYKFGGEP